MGKICDPPPFSGGQCAERGYFVRYQWRQFALDGSVIIGWTQAQQQGLGAIGRVYTVNYDDTGSNTPTTGIGVIFTTYAHRPAPIKVLTLHGFQVRNAILEIRNISVTPMDGLIDNCGDPPGVNCRCTPDSCRVDCATAPDGFCCIDHSLTNRLLQTLQG